MKKYPAHHSLRTGLLSLAILVAIGGAAVAQSGSAGGSIGNDEKSLSGSREAPRAVDPSKPARRAKFESNKSESDEPRRASGKSGGQGALVAAAISTAPGLR